MDLRGMDVKKFEQLFNDKKVKYGGYSSIMIAVVIAILIVINLVVDQIPLKWDLTANQMYSLSDQTYKILDNLDQEVNIIALYEAGKGNAIIDEILDRYTSYSDKVKIEYVDPVKNPGFVKKFDEDGQGISQGSLIVTSGDKVKVISSYDLYNYSYQDYTPQIESLAVEQRVTGGIMYVTSDENPKIYVLQGHGELGIPYDVQKQLETENYEVEDLNLVTADAVPEDADILFISSPKRDLTEEEEEKIRDYLENSGKAVFLMDILDTEVPNFESILKSYGVGLQKGLIIEQDKNHYVSNPLYLVPNLESHDIVTPIKSTDMYTLMPAAQPVEELDVKRRSLEIEPLLTTSEEAWLKTDFDDQSLEKGAEDISGAFNIAVAITDKPDDYEAEPTQLVVIGNSSFINGQFATQIPGNMNFLLNSFNWLRGEEESISIRPKSLTLQRLNMTSQQILILSIIVVIVIPAIVFIMGIVVWSRRRHL